MRIFALSLLLFVSANVFATLPVPSLTTSQLEISKKKPSVSTRNSTAKLLQKMPLYFEKNIGQHPQEFYFVAKTAFSQFAFADDRVVIRLKGQNNKAYKQFSLLFEGGVDSPVISANEKSKYKVNYFRGKKSQWRENIDTFSEITYQDIYPGIDIKFYFNQSRLEYDFIVDAGVDPSIIRFKYENTDNVSISSNKTLDILVNNGLVKQQAPIIYQLVNNKKKIINGEYLRKGNGFTFALANYDSSKELIIDPVIEFSTYFGGNWEDNATSVATDSLGNIFFAGSTSAQARITVNNIMTLENASLTTMNDAGKLSTYDGEHGLALPVSSDVNGGWLDLNTNEKVTIVNGAEVREAYEYTCDYRYGGFFSRDDMKTDYDAFISKLDSNYNQIYTTYYGGCRNDGIRDMVIHNDSVYVYACAVKIYDD